MWFLMNIVAATWHFMTGVRAQHQSIRNNGATE
jgi:hypothetical protein